MSEVTYGFIDENSILISTAIFVEGDIDTIERVKNEFDAYAYHKMDLEKELALLGTAYWNGSRFLWPSPFPSWAFNEDINDWEAPVPPPEFDQEDPKYYVWDEDSLSWKITA